MNLRPPARHPDWEPRLLEYLRGVAHRPFAWGDQDCLIFTLGAVDAMTGSGLASLIKGRYVDEDGAWRVCREFGYQSHIHYVARNFKARESKFHIMRGDIVALPGLGPGRSLGLGICQGEHSYVLAETRLATVGNHMIRKGFAV